MYICLAQSSRMDRERKIEYSAECCGPVDADCQNTRH